MLVSGCGHHGLGTVERVDAALLVLLGPGDEPISAAGIEAMLGAEHNTTVRDVEVAAVDLRVFDQLFSVQEVLQ